MSDVPSVTGGTVKVGTKRFRLDEFSRREQALMERIRAKQKISDDDILILAVVVSEHLLAQHLQPGDRKTDKDVINSLLDVLDDPRVVEATFRKIRSIIGHQFEELTPENRPQDPRGDGRGLKFEPLEHGGAEPDSMPQAIQVTDRKGRWA